MWRHKVEPRLEAKGNAGRRVGVWRGERERREVLVKNARVGRDLVEARLGTRGNGGKGLVSPGELQRIVVSGNKTGLRWESRSGSSAGREMEWREKVGVGDFFSEMPCNDPE